MDQHSIVAITDIHGTIKYANQKFCDISQYSESERVGKNHRILNSGYHSKEFFSEIYQAIYIEQVWQGEIKNKAKDGSCYWVDSSIVPCKDENGKVMK